MKGITIDGEVNALIDNNNITSQRYGVEAGGIGVSKISNNIIDSKNIGIRYATESKGEVTGNKITGCNSIILEGFSHVKLIGNTLNATIVALECYGCAVGEVLESKSG